MESFRNNETGVFVDYEFKNKYTGEKEDFSYEVPYKVLINAIRNYFDFTYDVVIKSKDNDLWNMLVDFDDKYDTNILDGICDELEDRLKEICEEDAKIIFDDLCEDNLEDEE